LTTIAQALKENTPKLDRVSATPALDAQTLLAHSLGKSRTWILTHSDAELSANKYSSYQKAIDLVAEGFPLPYVIGQWEFYGLNFLITPDTLIPRPETELLVEHALSWLSNNPDRRLAADIGTGSGCIAVTLAKHVNDLSIFANDISFQALKVARSNSIQHKVNKRVHYLQADLFPPIGCQFDLICANLPYIPTATLSSLAVYGREPDLALDGGVDGLELINNLLKKTPKLIAPGGLMLFEIEASQETQVKTLADQTFPRADIQVLPDLAGQQRLLVIQQ
jgi:release factor glutamine methyltransferase